MEGIYEEGKCVKILGVKPGSTDSIVSVRPCMGGFLGSVVLKNCRHLNSSDARFKTFVAVFTS